MIVGIPWIYPWGGGQYPLLGKTMGGPEYSIEQEHLWIYGISISILLGVVSMSTVINLVRRNFKQSTS